MDYTEYLKTDHWHEFRARAINNAGRRCCLCSECRCLEVHHNNYDCLWEEKFSDVAVLCRGCHEKFHDVILEPEVVRVVLPVQTALERLRERIARTSDDEKRERLVAQLFVLESDLSPEDMARRLVELRTEGGTAM